MQKSLFSKLFKRAWRSAQRECPTYTPLYSSTQNPVFEIVHGESVIVYLHMYSGNVQQNPLCVESSCVTKVFSIFPRFSPTIFSRVANSVLLLQIPAHLCTAVLIGSMRRTLCLKLFVRRAWRSIYTCTAGMFSRTLYAWNPVSLRNIPSPPALANDVWSRCEFNTLSRTPLYSSRLYAQKILGSKLFKRA